MRLLMRLGDKAHIGEGEELALMREPLQGPSLLDNLDALQHTALALCIGESVSPVCLGIGATSYAKIQTPEADQINDGSLLCDTKWVS